MTMFSLKKRRRRRRSELRHGVQSINYEATASHPRLSIVPVLKFWQRRGARLSGLLILVLLSWALYLLVSQPMFFVYGAEIKGNVAVSAREIYIASGIDSQSVFWINPARVADRIVGLPNIKSASVSVSLPAQVRIEVVERRPELLWQTGDTVWWVDHEGMIVPPKGDLTGMFRIVDDDRQPLKAGFQIDQTIVQGAQTLRMLVPDVSFVRYSRSKGLTAATPEGWPVYLGEGSQIKAKLVVLTAVLAELKERNVTPAYIDLRDPLRPVYQPQSIIRIGQPPPGPSTGPPPPSALPQ